MQYARYRGGGTPSTPWVHPAPLLTHAATQWSGQSGVQEPWALSLRFTLGSGSFATQDPLRLFIFVSRMSASFPDQSRVRMERSDVGRATQASTA